MNITVIGTGYVGLVTGTCLAEMGNYVTCVDIDKLKVQKLKKGKLPIYEPDLDVLFLRNMRQGRLSFTTGLPGTVVKSQVIFLALPTPAGKDGSADLSSVLKVAEQLGSLIRHYTVVVNKSTVPVGTAEKVRHIIRKKCRSEFDVISNPEFLREGVAVEDFMKPDRVVVGTSSPRARKLMEQLYAPFVRQGNPIIFMDERSAELTKYAANAYLAMRVSFMNEIAGICEKTGANVDWVRAGMGSDSRIGKRFLFAGLGYGGSCFPKDVKALVNTAASCHYDFRILKAVMQVNEEQRRLFLDKVYHHFKNRLKGVKLAVWGIAFKPNTDDIRDAPAVEIIRKLVEAGAIVSAYDPEASENARKVFGKSVRFARDSYEAVRDAEALLILTEWSVFRTPDFPLLKKLLRKPVIFDGRNLYSPSEMKKLGFYYASVGRLLAEPPGKM